MCQRLEFNYILFGIYGCQLIYFLLYQAFVIPLFDYCNVVRRPCLAKQVKGMGCILSKVTFSN